MKDLQSVQEFLGEFFLKHIAQAHHQSEISLEPDDAMHLGLWSVSIIVDRSECKELDDYAKGFRHLMEKCSGRMPEPLSTLVKTDTEDFIEVGRIYASILARWINGLDRERAKIDPGYRDERSPEERRSRTLTEFFTEFVRNYYGKSIRPDPSDHSAWSDLPAMILPESYTELGWRCLALAIGRATGTEAGITDLCAPLEADVAPEEFEELGRGFIYLMGGWAVGHDCPACIAERGYSVKDYLKSAKSRRTAVRTRKIKRYGSKRKR